MDPKKLAEINEELSSLMRKAFAGGTEVRFHNENVNKCWMMYECPDPYNCPVYGKKDVRCWQAIGTFSEEGGCCRLQKVLDCRKCEVYQTSMGKDPLVEIGETFNNMMHLIERTQGRLVEMEKLATTGKLAASVAHEINNPLFGIANYVDLIKARSDGDEKIDHYTNVIKEAIDQIQSVTRGLLELARPRVPHPAMSDLHHEIGRAISLIQPKAAKQKVEIKTELDENIPEFKLDVETMQEVFLNLMINALESMPDSGEIRIRTSRKGAYVEIEVQDTGHGIEEADLTRVFDLFFSKKMIGIGTGIGLYTARRIIENHGGKINVQSRVGEGTRFNILMPIRK